MARTYRDNLAKQQANLTPAQIRANKCQRSRQRNEARQTVLREDAAIRQEVYDKLSVSDKLKLLDSRLGVGIGAKRQRKKLTKLLETA